MPILKTKYEEIEVKLDDELKLVIPSEYSKPCIYKRGTNHLVQFWDLTDDKKRTLAFKTLEEAEKYRDGVTWTRDQVMKTVSVAEVLDKQFYYQKYHRLCPQKIDYEEQEVPLDPLFFGIWIGDGGSYSCKITTADKEILDYVTEVVETYGMKVVQEKYAIDYHITNGNKDTAGGSLSADKELVLKAIRDMSEGKELNQAAREVGVVPSTLKRYLQKFNEGTLDAMYESRKQNPITLALKGLGVWRNKHIPKCYLENSRDVRLKVLAGIIDTDGYLQRESGYDMCFASKKLLDDIVTLARSLGFSARDPTPITKMCTNAAGGPKACQAYRTYIRGGNDLRDIPVLLDRKRIKKSKVQRYDQDHFEIVSDEVVTAV